MSKSGLADSPFFAPAPQKVEPIAPPLADPPVQHVEPVKIKKPKIKKVKQPSNRGITTPRIHGVLIEMVRKAVKEFGKEAATHRFTEAEKKEIGDLIYTYKNRGIKTSENEITRIAVNFVVEDYKENGENSVLYKIIEALNE